MRSSRVGGAKTFPRRERKQTGPRPNALSRRPRQPKRPPRRQRWPPRRTPTPAPAASAAPRAGWLSKVTLKPGTAVEYETVETALVGDFSGWSVGTLFTLSNGQRWRVVNGSYVAPKDSTPRKVRIVPGVLGSFFLEIEGIRSRPKVAFAGAAP
jgi:hypothetical protein